MLLFNKSVGPGTAAPLAVTKHLQMEARALKTQTAEQQHNMYVCTHATTLWLARGSRLQTQGTAVHRPGTAVLHCRQSCMQDK